MIIPGLLEEWWNNGELHREGEPAVSYARNNIENGNVGSKMWFYKGKLHREDGPAKIYNDGSEMWYYEGEYHRVDGPALVDKSENICKWFINGKEMTEEEHSAWRADKEKCMRVKSVNKCEGHGGM